MADQFTYTKLPSDPCLTQEQMLAYIDGKLSVADQHVCEKHLLDCAMCEDALEGLSLVKDRAVLTAPLQKENGEEPKVIPLQGGSSQKKIWYAAAAVFVLVLASVFFMNQFTGADREMAENTAMDSSVAFTAPVPADKTLADSLSNIEEKDAESSRLMNGQENEKIMAPAPQPDASRSMAPVTLADGAGAPQVAEEIFAFENVPQAEAKDDAYNDAPVLNEPKAKEEKEEQEEIVVQEKPTFWERTKITVPVGGIQQNRTDKKTTLADENKNADLDETPAPPQTAVSGTASNQQMDSVSSESINLELSYQNGVNLLNAGQANAAISLFDQVLQDKTHPRYEDAEFQKANALIKANRKEEAKTLLKSIEAKKGKYAAEATDLLKSL